MPTKTVAYSSAAKTIFLEKIGSRISSENESRGEWKRGIVVRTFSATDGQVRSAEVKAKSGILKRPASKLAVLDVREK